MDSNNAPDRLKSLRWLVGLLFLSAFGSFLFSYGAYIITSEKEMKPTLAKTLDLIFRQEGMQEATPMVNYLNELSKHQKELAAIQTFSTLDQAQIEKDMANMTPEQSQKYLEEKLAGPLYESSKVAEALQKVDPNKKVEASEMEMVTVATANTHDLLKRSLPYQIILLIILLLAIVLLSRGMRKILTPALLILLSALPGFLIFNYSKGLIKRYTEMLLSEYASRPLFSDLTKEVFYPLMDKMGQVYKLPVYIGLGLIVILLILKFALKQKMPKPAGQLV